MKQARTKVKIFSTEISQGIPSPLASNWPFPSMCAHVEVPIPNIFWRSYLALGPCDHITKCVFSSFVLFLLYLVCAPLVFQEKVQEK